MGCVMILNGVKQPPRRRAVPRTGKMIQYINHGPELIDRSKSNVGRQILDKYASILL